MFSYFVLSKFFNNSGISRGIGSSNGLKNAFMLFASSISLHVEILGRFCDGIFSSYSISVSTTNSVNTQLLESLDHKFPILIFVKYFSTHKIKSPF